MRVYYLYLFALIFFLYSCDDNNGINSLEENDMEENEVEENDEKTVVFELPYYDTVECLNATDIDSCALQEMLIFIYSNLQYPEEALSNEIEGDVPVEFEIAIDGIPVNHRVTDTVGFGCDEEAIRLISLLEFIPARNSCDEIIESTMTIFIKFRL